MRSIDRFIAEEVILDDDGYCFVLGVYDDYCSFCDKRKLKQSSLSPFESAISRLKGVTIVNHTNHPNGRCFVGVTLKHP